MDNINHQPDNQCKLVSLRAVTTGSEENKSFAKYTPAGTLYMTISDETQAADLFEQGKEYYLDISAAEAAPVEEKAEA